MGRLDHSTNNIILDAVLTDTGRQYLSRNDGSFSIVKFAFSDEEVDYTFVEKFGVTVGKEKIEKNTPIFEAITNSSQSQRYKMKSLSIPNLTRIPSIGIATSVSDPVALNIIDTRSTTVTFQQDVGGTEVVPVELVDQVFEIRVNNLFVQFGGGIRPVTIDKENIAKYLIRRDSSVDTTTGGSSVTLQVVVKTSLTTKMFDTYGTQTDKSIIRTPINVRGLQSGSEKTINIEISKTA